jgi:hypothetical protein
MIHFTWWDVTNEWVSEQMNKEDFLNSDSMIRVISLCAYVTQHYLSHSDILLLAHDWKKKKDVKDELFKVYLSWSALWQKNSSEIGFQHVTVNKLLESLPRLFYSDLILDFLKAFFIFKVQWNS